uniref:D-isomer specific 2-hydroxyacid dehydrogenase catalytic domain-containing protein n=2 Tax=Lotharella oceanica TaxID=641309 RepID=A0A7S2XIS7_9EUKA|mmetsp:Transcript_4758/g.9492  ORF Transcript_4758/g.9492 Transcript_4758/m.9492 type:complete len:333 (+) Transcript_4758:77-1075(+)
MPPFGYEGVKAPPSPALFPTLKSSFTRNGAKASRHVNIRHTSTKPKVLVALYPDPKSGYPPNYARKDIPKIESYPDGQTVPSPKEIDFVPGELLGCVSGELGLRKFLEANGYELVVTSDKDGKDCEMDEHLPEAEVVISQPFYLYYLTRQRIDKAPNLKMAITAGIGSDHVDLDAAMEHKVDVTEVTFSNSISVAEHAVMMILALVRNYIPSHLAIIAGDWAISDCVSRAYDVEGMHIGTVAAGRIGLAVLRRMHPFGCKLHYCDRHRLSAKVEQELDLVYHQSPQVFVAICHSFFACVHVAHVFRIWFQIVTLSPSTALCIQRPSIFLMRS